jgi:hypothetical protein
LPTFEIWHLGSEQAAHKKEEKMKLKSNLLLIQSLFLILLLGICFLEPASAQSFKITITNLSPNVLSPTAFITHNAGFDLFNEGSSASPEVQLLAETGNNTGVLGLASHSASVLDYKAATGGILHQGSSGMALIDADPAHQLLTFMAMMGISNDGFIGGTTGDGAISLFSGNTPLGGTYIISPADVWDAGTEVNDELATSVGALGAGPTDGVDENGIIHKPHPGILGIGDIPISFNWTGGPVARININPVPEPSTFLLLGFGLGCFLAFRKVRFFRIVNQADA